LKDKYFDEATPFLDFRHVNEGFLFILFYLVLFLHPQSPPFFGIDNLDTALNPKLAAKLTSLLTQLAKERQKQVIVTTHNPMLLDGLDLKDEEVRLFAVYRNASGHTTVRRIRPENNNIRLSEAWIRGYLGALPMI
jgi:predicted ATPase